MHALPVLLVLLLAAGDEEPRFQGRTAAEWAEALDRAEVETYDAHIRTLATGGDAALAVLVRMLESDVRIACWSLAPLIEMGETAAPAVPTLVRCLGREEFGMDVVDVLVEIGPRAVPRVCEVLASKSSLTRLHATIVLANNLPAPDVVAFLTRALGDASADVREVAAEGLVRMESEEAATIRALARALRDEREDTRVDAATALLGVSPATGLVLLDWLAALEDGSEDVRRIAGAALRNDSLLGFPGRRIRIDRLRALLTSDDPVRRATGLRLVADCGPSSREVLTPVLALLRDPDDELRLLAANSLGSVDRPSPAIVAALLTALQDKASEVRRAAARALGRMEPETVHLPDLRGRLAEEKDARVRVDVLRALRDLGPALGKEAEAVAAELGCLADTTDVAIAESALRALEPPASRMAIPALIRALGSDDAGLRRVAAECLGDLGPVAAPAREALRRGAEDDDLHARVAAVVALARIDERPAVGARRLRSILEELDDPSERMDLLGRIHELSPDPEFVVPRALEIVHHEPVGDWGPCTVLSLAAVREVALPRLLAALDDTAIGDEEAFASDVFTIGERCDERDWIATDLVFLDEPSIPALIEPLRKARAVSVRWRIALALGEMEAKPASAVPALVEAMRDSKEDLRVRWAAAMSLAKIAKTPEVALPALLDAPGETDDRLRWYAIDALGAYGEAARSDRSEAAPRDILPGRRRSPDFK